jgi:hypothetical protein
MAQDKLGKCQSSFFLQLRIVFLKRVGFAGEIAAALKAS